MSVGDGRPGLGIQLAEHFTTSLPETSGHRIMDIGENPNMIPEDLLKLQMRGIMGTVPNP